MLQAGGGWLAKVTGGWQAGRISNLDYLLYCNLAAGRSFNDLTQVSDCSTSAGLSRLLPGHCCWRAMHSLLLTKMLLLVPCRPHHTCRRTTKFVVGTEGTACFDAGKPLYDCSLICALVEPVHDLSAECLHALEAAKVCMGCYQQGLILIINAYFLLLGHKRNSFQALHDMLFSLFLSLTGRPDTII